MEKVNRAKGRDLFVDEDTCRRIHPNNNKTPRKSEDWENDGIFYRHGAWSKKETARLLENWQTFLNENPSVEEPLKLLEGVNSDRHRIAQETDFYLTISKTLNRSTFACFSRLQRILQREMLKNDKFSEKETQKLEKYLKRYGPNYSRIARKMGRTRQSVQDKHRRLMKEVYDGKWSKKEEKLLLRTLKEVTGEDNLIRLRFMEIPWRNIAKLVPSRHEEQCRAHFFNIKKWKLQEDLNTPRWKRKHSCRLVTKISAGNYEVETDIDWNELNKEFEDISPSPIYLQSRFHVLKSKLDEFHRRDFTDIVEILKNKYA